MNAAQTPPLAYLVSRYPAVSHTFILREIAQLRALGHQIHTASINPPDRAIAAMDATERAEAQATYFVKQHGWRGALAAGLHHLVHQPASLLRLWRATRGLGLGTKGLAYAAEAAMVARWMQDRQLAHLHVHFGNAGATVGLLTKAMLGCHLSYTIHGPDEFDDVPGQRLAQKMAGADAVICISQFARSQLMRISDPTHWPKFSVCRLGVDPALFSFQPRPAHQQATQLLCVGRLTPAKGQVVLVQACSVLRDQGLDFKLTLVGDGPDRARIEAAIAAHRLQDHIELPGAVGQDRVRAELAAADVFVLPSFAEGIPVVLMEAMASGVPCVSTPVNGIPELIQHQRTGLLAVPGDVASLVDQLASLIRSPALRQSMATLARAQVEAAFDLGHNTRALSRLLAAFPRRPMPAPAAVLAH